MNITTIARRTTIAAGLAVAAFGLSTGTASAGDFNNDTRVVVVAASSTTSTEDLPTDLSLGLDVDGTTEGPMAQTREHVFLAAAGEPATNEMSIETVVIVYERF